MHTYVGTVLYILYILWSIRIYRVHAEYLGVLYPLYTRVTTLLTDLPPHLPTDSTSSTSVSALGFQIHSLGVSPMARAALVHMLTFFPTYGRLTHPGHSVCQGIFRLGPQVIPHRPIVMCRARCLSHNDAYVRMHALPSTVHM